MDLQKIFSIKVAKDRIHKTITILGIKIKIRKGFFKKLQNYERDKKIIQESKFWNPLWYVQQYGYNFTRQEALEYWYRKGCKKGESPSKYINVKHCKIACGGLNPIIAYLDKELVFYPDNKNNYKEENDAERIKEYLEYKSTRQAQGVVYTCITNDYDDLREIEIYKYIDKNWDYVCFTDNQEHINLGQIGIWEIRPLFFNNLDNTRNQRWHKTHPHILFPNYEESVWIDGNINILTNKLYETIKQTPHNILVPEHFKNLCIYTEYQDVLAFKLDDIKVIKKELELIQKACMPANYGFAETNILYRKHHNETIVKCMDMWWDFIKKYSKRDQLAFTYVLWNCGIKPADINTSNTRLDIENYYVFGHKKGRE